MKTQSSATLFAGRCFLVQNFFFLRLPYRGVGEKPILKIQEKS